VATKLVQPLLATPKRHWVATKLVQLLLATPKRHWVATKLADTCDSSSILFNLFLLLVVPKKKDFPFFMRMEKESSLILRKRIDACLSALEDHCCGPKALNDHAEIQLLTSVLEKERQEHARRVEDLLGSMRRMEQLLLSAVEENKGLRTQSEINSKASFHWDLGQVALTEVRAVNVTRCPDGHSIDRSASSSILESLLLGIAVASALKATPATLESASNCGVIEIEGADGATEWRRVSASKTLSNQSCRFELVARTSSGDLWWPQAVATCWCAEPKASVPSLLMKWHRGICVTQKATDAATNNFTEILAILNSYHRFLSSGRAVNCVVLDFAGHQTALLESTLLGDQQMLYTVACSWSAPSNLTVLGEWLTTETLIRRQLTICDMGRIKLTSVTNVFHEALQLLPNAPTARVGFHSRYSSRDCTVKHGIECNWDAWVAHDFHAIIVQLAHSNDEGRRSTATMIPRSDGIGCNRFAFYCGDWGALSPPRSDPNDDVGEPCIVTFLAKRCDDRALRFPLMVSDAPTYALPVNIDGHDCLGSSVWWLPLGNQPA
jgi:hypothetical protein